MTEPSAASCAAHVDYLIKNGQVLTLVQGAPLIRSGFVAVKGSEIVGLGSMDGLPSGLNAAAEIDAAGCLVMPGLINAHCHCAMTLFRGLADDLPLMTWLNEHMFPAEANHVRDDVVYWGAKLAAAEMLLSGTTTVVDGYFLQDQTIGAIRESGLRGIIGQGVLDFPAPGVPDPSRNIDVAREFIHRHQDPDGRVRPSVFCHSAYTCSRETLIKGKELARRENVLFQIHLSETAAEVERITAEQGLRPAAYLDELGILDDATLVVHCVHLNQAEIDILAKRRTPAAICVESNMKLASGLPPVAAMMEAGIPLGLGTDGPASNNDLNLFGEMRTLALVLKTALSDPTAMPAATALSMAAPKSARMLGMDRQIGCLAPGMKADLVILDWDAPHLKPGYHPESDLVYAAGGREVKTVMVDGRIVVDQGEIQTFDLEETMTKVRGIAARVGQGR